MLSNRLVFSGLALACVTAAGAGGYLATRQANLATEAAGMRDQTAVATPVVRETEAPVKPAATQVAHEASEAPTAAVPTPASTASGVEPRQREASRTRTDSRTAASPAAVRRAPEPSSPSATARGPLTRDTSDRPSERRVSEMPRTVPPSVSPAEPQGSTADAAPSPSENRPSQAEAALGQDAPAVTAAGPSSQVNFEELTVAADSVIGFDLDRSLSSDRARVEDRVEARVARDVRVSRRVAIPAGSKALGTVVVVDRGGKFKERARLGIRFNTLILTDGTRLPIQTDTIFRYGDAPGDSSAKKIGGGAVAGAILGAIIGGAKGAAVGATAGAGGGTAMVMAGERNAAEFPPGAEVTARILSPVTVTVER